MTSYLCKACATQYPPADAPPGACPICEDPRQYIPHDDGQQWVEWRAFVDAHAAEIRVDHGILGFGCEPAFAIGQRALLVKSSAGNVLWDCAPYLDDGSSRASAPKVGWRRSPSHIPTTTPR